MVTNALAPPDPEALLDGLDNANGANDADGKVGLLEDQVCYATPHAFTILYPSQVLFNQCHKVVCPVMLVSTAELGPSLCPHCRDGVS
jgi:hypothetical protein